MMQFFTLPRGGKGFKPKKAFASQLEKEEVPAIILDSFLNRFAEKTEGEKGFPT
jgi:hypothetical protein